MRKMTLLDTRKELSLWTGDVSPSVSVADIVVVIALYDMCDFDGRHIYRGRRCVLSVSFEWTLPMCL